MRAIIVLLFLLVAGPAFAQVNGVALNASTGVMVVGDGLASCDGPSPNPLAWWKLDSSSGAIAYDSSGNGYNGSVTGGTWQPAGGHFAGDLSFNGSTDYVMSGGVFT